MGSNEWKTPYSDSTKKKRFKVGDKVKINHISDIMDWKKYYKLHYPDGYGYIECTEKGTKDRYGSFDYWIKFEDRAGATYNDSYGFWDYELEPWIDPNLIDEDLFEI